MDMDLGKLWITGGAGLIGAIGGGWIWAQRAAAELAKRVPEGSDDALIQQAASAGTSSLVAAFQGGAVGAVIGVMLALAYLYFTDPDREMVIRKVDTGDDRY
jgi:hypothetical protein